jgi:K+ transporter
VSATVSTRIWTDLRADCSKRRSWLARASLRLFTLMFRNSVRSVDLFNIPPKNFVEIGRQIEI